MWYDVQMTSHHLTIFSQSNNIDIHFTIFFTNLLLSHHFSLHFKKDHQR